MLRRCVHENIKAVQNDNFSLIFSSKFARSYIFVLLRGHIIMNTFVVLLVTFASLNQIVFDVGNGLAVEESLLSPSSQLESLSQSKPLAVRQISFNVDTGSGRRPGMFSDASTVGDTALGVLRGSSLTLAEALVNVFSGLTSFINMIQNYVQTGSFQLNNLSASSQALTSRLLGFGSNAATSVMKMLNNEMSSSVANGATSLSGFNAAIPSGQFITSESASVRPLQIETGRQSSSTLLPGNSNTSGGLGISGQSASISSTQPQISASFPNAAGTSNAGTFGQRVGGTGTSGGGNTGSVLGWGAPGNGVSWGSSGAGNSFGWGSPNGIVGWRGSSTPAGSIGWGGANSVPGSAVSGTGGWGGVNSASGLNGLNGISGSGGWGGANGAAGSGGVNGVSGSGGWGGVNGGSGSGGWGGLNGGSGSGGWGGVNGGSGSGGYNGVTGWYSPNSAAGWYPGGVVGWRGSPIGIWGPVGGLSGSATSGGLSGWGGPMVGWGGPLGVGAWGNGPAGSGASGGTFGWGTPNGAIGWNGPGGTSGAGGFGGASGWDNSLGFDSDVSSMDLVNDFSMYGAGGSTNTTGTASPLIQLFETIVSGGFSLPTPSRGNAAAKPPSNGNNTNSTVTNP